MTDTTELWDIGQVATYLGIQPGSARGTLSRWGVRAVDRRQIPGGRVQAYYDAGQVRAAAASRPGRGVRTDLRTG